MKRLRKLDELCVYECAKMKELISLNSRFLTNIPPRVIIESCVYLLLTFPTLIYICDFDGKDVFRFVTLF